MNANSITYISWWQINSVHGRERATPSWTGEGKGVIEGLGDGIAYTAGGEWSFIEVIEYDYSVLSLHMVHHHQEGN